LALLAVAGVGYGFDSAIRLLVPGTTFGVSAFTFVGEAALMLWLGPGSPRTSEVNAGHILRPRRVLGVSPHPSDEDDEDEEDKETDMQARMANPALSVPGAFDALQALAKAARHDGVPEACVGLVHLRASQINGCSVCVDMHARDLKKAGESYERIWAVGAWREAPYFTEAERAALALTEAVTRLSDSADPVPDQVYDAAAEHFEEPALASLILQIAMINTWNRLNAATRQVAGAW
jgi:AhpD family alkylhydroperoxidase